MASFSESFTRGYTRGSQAKIQREELARRDRTEAEEQRRHEVATQTETERYNAQTKRQSEQDKISLGEKKLATQLLLAQQKANEAGEGEIEEEFDLSHLGEGMGKVKIRMKGALGKKRDELELGEEFEGEESQVDIPEIGVEKGKRIKPISTNAAVNVFEAKMRAKVAEANRRAQEANRLDPNDPDIQAAVQDAADRVVSGEMTIDAARGLLGGVKGGLGTPLLRALGDRKIVPKEVRTSLKEIDNTRSQVRIIEGMARDVANAKTTEERAIASKVLSEYTQSTASLFARGFGDTRISDQDVKRVLKIVPGWIAANFAPKLVEAEVKTLYDILDRTEENLSNGYFRQVSKSGVRLPANAPPPPPGFTEVVEED